jgi:hypothetical protein
MAGADEGPRGSRRTGILLPSGPEADRVFVVEEASASLLASGLVANDPAHFAVRVPAGTTIH